MLTPSSMACKINIFSQKTLVDYPAAASCLAIASVAQSSQQTVISLPATVTFTPPSVISQSQTGHFDAAIFFASQVLNL